MPVTMSPLAIILPGTQCPQSGLGACDTEGTGGGSPHRPLEPVVPGVGVMSPEAEGSTGERPEDASGAAIQNRAPVMQAWEDGVGRA